MANILRLGRRSARTTALAPHVRDCPLFFSLSSKKKEAGRLVRPFSAALKKKNTEENSISTDIKKSCIMTDDRSRPGGWSSGSSSSYALRHVVDVCALAQVSFFFLWHSSLNSSGCNTLCVFLVSFREYRNARRLGMCAKTKSSTSWVVLNGKEKRENVHNNKETISYSKPRAPNTAAHLLLSRRWRRSSRRWIRLDRKPRGRRGDDEG